MMTDPRNIPVLFLVFNRPEETRRVFEAIRAAKPKRLYVAADGPRPTKAGESERCSEVRRIATEIDWSCETKTLFRAANLGCRRAVSGALDWFFEQEESGIVLEDDCLPDASWFAFASEMLAEYREDERIMCVSASHFHGDAHHPSASYFFSRYNHCWGWASWRRAWRHYDHDMRQWAALRESDWLLSIGDGSRRFQRYWTNIFDVASAGVLVDSWAYRWTFSCWAQSGMTVLPARNLVENIGVGEAATHTVASTANPGQSRLESLTLPLTRPACVVRDVAADRWSDEHVFHIDRWTDLKARARSIPAARSGVRALRRLRRLGHTG